MNKAEDLVKKALRTLDRGNWLKATMYLRKSCELYPEYVEAYFELADIYFHLGHLEAAHEVIIKALERNPLDFPCNFLLGNIYLARGKIQEALRIYLRLKKMVEDPPSELLFQIALAYYAKGSKDKALYYSLRTIEEDPSSIEAYELAAKICFDKGDLPSAKEIYMEIISMEFDNVRAHHMLGLIYSKERHWLEAIQEWETVLAISPDEVETLRELAWTLNMLGDEDNALRLFHRILEINPENTQARQDIYKILQDRT